MTTTPTLTYDLDPTTFEVLTDALEHYAAHQELLTHDRQFTPTTEDRTTLLLKVLHADELRRTIETAAAAGQVTITLDPSTYQVLTEALATYHADQMHAAAEATAEHDDPEDGDPARQAAATADRLHLQAIEATQLTPHD
ncbi:hypothetical protein [Kocuria turfanensis]|uniref:Uncharacterized protein n=1 Tax=Kocuria turfanensis TaxID=388357 RepID=A0A512II21_9MICC|nr:hypothetical protein [Kocuria turfanensis]GEO97321.1 hypothetical protein KTU01_34440 [Kocuria turfanensis]